MAIPFVRLDLSPGSRDFEPAILQAGLPLLDERDSRYPVLRKWLGALVAEPERRGYQVSFYLRSPAGARWERAQCVPVTEADLKGALKQEFADLMSAATRAVATDTDEQMLLAAVRRELAAIHQDSQQNVRCSYLFKYRDHNKHPRLVWCPGYHRKDADPAPPEICDHPDCLSLFVKRGGSGQCPICAARAPALEQAPGGKRRSLSAAALLVALAVAAGWYQFYGPGSQPTPEQRKLDGMNAAHPDPHRKASGNLHVEPAALTLNYGEVATLSITGAADDAPLRIISSAPDVAESLGGHRLVGLIEGRCQVDVTQGEEVASLQVTVTSEPYAGLSFAPEKISLRPGEATDVRVIGKVGEREGLEVCADLLDWISLPNPALVSLEKSPLRVRGLKPTGPEPELLLARFAGQEARGAVNVVSGELQLELIADGPTNVPVGQFLALQASAVSENHRDEIPAAQVDFQADPIDGLVLRDGAVHALRPGLGPLRVRAHFGGAVSNELTVNSVAAVPLKLAIKAHPSSLSIGQTGLAELSGSSEAGPVSLSLIGAAYESSDPETVAIDRESGVFEARKAGKAVLTATHPAAAEPVHAEVAVEVSPPEAPGKTVKTLHLIAVDKQRLPIKMPVGAQFAEYRVEAEDEDGARHDVTAHAKLSIDGDAGTAAIAVRDAKIAGLRPGAGLVQAEYAGLHSAESLAFEITSELDADRIQVAPESLTLAVGESPRLIAIGYKGDQTTGEITNVPGLEWHAQNTGDGQALSGAGPLSAFVASHVGAAQVTASFRTLVSNAAVVHVVEHPDQVPEALTVAPGELQLAVGESRPLARGISVMRGRQNVIDLAQVSSAAEDVVGFDENLRALVGKARGRTRVVFSYGGQLASLDVEVVPAPAAAADAVLELDPPGGAVQVGERLQIHGFEANPSHGQVRVDRTQALLLSSSAADVLRVDGTALVGIKPGTAKITAQLSGIAAPVEAQFTVVDQEFTQLVVEPARMNLASGARKRYVLYAVGPNGRVRLGPHDDLKISVTGQNPAAIEHDAAQGEVRGATEGEALLTFQWRNLPEAKLPVMVKLQAGKGIRIVPVKAVLAAGQRADFQVFARRGEDWSPLATGDGLALRVAGPEIASLVDGLQIEGVQPGTTHLIAEYQGSRATAVVHVIGPRDAARLKNDAVVGHTGWSNFTANDWHNFGAHDGAPVRSGGTTVVGGRVIGDRVVGGPVVGSRVVGGHVAGGHVVGDRVVGGHVVGDHVVRGPIVYGTRGGYLADGTWVDDVSRYGSHVITDRRPIGLRFDNDAVRVQHGVPGHPVRVLQDHADGSVEDVTDRAHLTEHDPHDVVDVDRTGGNAVVHTNKTGRAALDASLDGLKTRQPLGIEVVDADARHAVLRVIPDPLRIAVGQSREIERAEVVPAPGVQPFELPIRLEAKSDVTIEVDTAGKSIRGLQPGRSSVTVAPVDPTGKYQELRTVVLVEVYDGAADEKGSSEKGGKRLVLDGPARTSVGAEIALAVELRSGPESGRIVTSEARLSLVPGEEELASPLPGCRLAAKMPGRVRVTATLGDLASNVLEVRIDPPASEFSKLLLVVDSSPMSLGQVRKFVVWGLPQGGGPRQDLTSLLADQPAHGANPHLVITSTEGPTPLRLRQPGSLVAAAAGTARVQAAIGDKLTSDTIEIRVAADASPPAAIRIDPRQAVIPQGDPTAVGFRVLVRAAGTGDFREVAGAKIESLDPAILAPQPDDPSKFRAVKQGTVQVKATIGDLSDTAEVRVTANLFETVAPTLGEVRQNEFNFDVAVTGDRSNDKEQPEYRVLVDQNAPRDVSWTQATVAGDRVTVKLTTPFIALVNRQQVYRVFIQVRDRNNPSKVEVYPCWVKFDLSKAR
ncbi:MAG TPA: hypothetical protein VGM05_19895 [Planctomycetaceae bacterium]